VKQYICETVKLNQQNTSSHFLTTDLLPFFATLAALGTTFFTLAGPAALALALALSGLAGLAGPAALALALSGLARPAALGTAALCAPGTAAHKIISTPPIYRTSGTHFLKGRITATEGSYISAIRKAIASTDHHTFRWHIW
jgi:hypothetical protein